MKRYGLHFLAFYTSPYGGASRKNCGGECHRGVSADTPRTYKLYVGPISPPIGGDPFLVSTYMLTVRGHTLKPVQLPLSF